VVHLAQLLGVAIVRWGGYLDFDFHVLDGKQLPEHEAGSGMTAKLMRDEMKVTFGIAAGETLPRGLYALYTPRGATREATMARRWNNMREQVLLHGVKSMALW
jgi:hypothetical protein